jgi:hypothetical protein
MSYRERKSTFDSEKKIEELKFEFDKIREDKKQIQIDNK